MSSRIFQLNYESSKGPTQVNNLKFKMQSPKGYIKLTLQGSPHQLDKQLQQIRQDLKQNYSDTRRCDNINVKDLFEAFEAVGCSVEGSQQDQEHFLEHYKLQRQVQDVTKVLHDDCGGAITIMAYFRDQKYDYLIESYREWPGYEP